MASGLFNALEKFNKLYNLAIESHYDYVDFTRINNKYGIFN